MKEQTAVEEIGWKSGDPVEALLTREWLVTNGLGGYASGTVAGACTRRYHGYLIAALAAPLGRMMMFNHLEEQFGLPDGRRVRLSGEENQSGVVTYPDAGWLEELRLEWGLPVWRYLEEDCVIEKRLTMPHLQNTTYLTYRLIEGPPSVELELRPSFHFRPHEALVSGLLPDHLRITDTAEGFEVSGDQNVPPLRLTLLAPRKSFTRQEAFRDGTLYRVERSRGYESEGALWSPGIFRMTLERGSSATLVASTEPWEMMKAMGCEEAFAAELARRQKLLRIADSRLDSTFAAELVLAADQFIITPRTRVADAARARAVGDEPRTVIAGYHWFTDWGRDTMISLQGLTLATGRYREAGNILRTFSTYVRDGLIPNMFPEGEHQGLYNTADATMWFFHAVSRYVDITNDRETLRQLLPIMLNIIDHHVRGTLFGIGVDPADGLLRQGAEGYQLTWMDAKVDDWVVTPRRGKAVEINALFYNALRLLQRWTGQESDFQSSKRLGELADRARASFNARFWYAEGGYLYDVIDGEKGDDSSLRPNQILALSLDHPVLDESRWSDVLEVVRRTLLTPVGLRSLAPGSPDYKRTYDGDLRSRDAAYHQGTVWGWLIGPFIDAWLRVHPEDRAGARRFLDGFVQHQGEACLGTISEIFDAEEPFTPRGCVAQAWSVAEVLRCMVLTF
jgi:predicted glycogen debranching enzyme